MPGTPVPYAWITGLPPDAQREIERNFAHLSALAGAATFFDAVIDSECGGANLTTHTYPTLVSLLANENWTGHLTVGVKQGPTQIVEPSTPALTGKGDLSLIGIGLMGTGGWDNTRTNVWQWKALTSAGYNVYMHGLYINPASSQQIMGTGYATAVACHFGPNVSGFSADGISGQGGQCWDCTFEGSVSVAGSVGVSVANTFFNCQIIGTVTVTSVGVATIYGGYVGGLAHASGSTGANLVAYCAIGGAVTIGSTANATVENLGAGNGSVTVTSTGSVAISGSWWSVSMTGVSTTQHSFYGDCGATFDFAGPGIVVANVGAPFGASTCKLRGTAVKADIQRSTFTIPAVDCIALKHSSIVLAFKDQGAGTKPYAFDASSNNNLLVISGVNQAGVTTPGTDVGTDNRVITETTDTLALLKALTNTYVFVGNASNVATGVAMSADATMANTGALTIAALAVTTGKINDLAVTTGKIAASAVTHAKYQDIANLTILGNNTGGVASPLALTAAQTKTLLAIAQADVTNLVADLAAKAPLASPVFTGDPTAPTPTAGDNDTSIATTAFVTTAVAGVAGMPTGGITMYGAAAAPTGYLLCNGAAVSRATYAALFAIIGTTFGAGDGSTTFNVPDMQDRLPMGASGTKALGSTLAAATHTHGAGSMAFPNHSHAVGTLVNSTSTVTGVTGTSATSSVTGVTGTNATSAVTGVTGTVSAHTHVLSGAGWAEIAMGTGVYMRRIAVTGYTDTHTSGAVAATATTNARTLGAPLGGATDSATPTFTYGAASGTAAAQVWTYGAASGTAAAQVWTYGAASGTAGAQTISGATASDAGAAITGTSAATQAPLPPYTALTFIIKT